MFFSLNERKIGKKGKKKKKENRNSIKQIVYRVYASLYFIIGCDSLDVRKVSNSGHFFLFNPKCVERVFLAGADSIQCG